MAIKKNNLPIIGKSDIADLPKFNLIEVSVKIDSGAYTSTIHCSVIEETPKGLRVVFLDEEENGYTGESFYFDIYEFKKVRSSSGELQERYAIEGEIILFGKSYLTEFTLSNRELMKYPILLGRKLISKNFLIDSSISNLSYKQKNKKK